MAAVAIEKPQPLAISRKIQWKKYPAAKTQLSIAKENENNHKLILLHAPNLHSNSQTTLILRGITIHKSGMNVQTETPAKPKPDKTNVELGDPTKVKPSALLYEITERTNQLAQPRTRPNQLAAVQHRVDVSRIREAKGRVLELSKPRTLPEVPRKPTGYVAPNALVAVATQRILELSRPKKQIRPPSPKRKEHVYESCSPRLTYLARPRQAMFLQSKLKSFLTSNDERIDLDELEQLGNWCTQSSKSWESRQQFYQSRRRGAQKGSSKATVHHGFKRKRIKKNPRNKLGASISNRTVISIDLNPKKIQRVKKGKKTRKPKRRKLFKSGEHVSRSRV